MKILLLLIALLVFGISVSHAGPNGGIAPSQGVLSGANPTPYQQQQMAEAEYIDQQERVAIAAQKAADKKAEQDAVVQAEYDVAVAKLTGEKDNANAKLNEKYSPIITDLESQALILKRKNAQLESQKSSTEKENARLRAKQLFRPKDMWRLLDGKVYNAKDKDWLQFTGTILEIKPNGILVHGDFGLPLEAGFGERDYFIENFPVQLYPMADGENFTPDMNLVAYFDTKSSTYQYTNTTIDLRVNTVRKLDYGKIVDTPPPDLAQKWNNIIIANDDNPQLTRELDDNLKSLSETESKLSQVKGGLDKEADSIIAQFQAKIMDLPNVFAQRAKDEKNEIKRAMQDKVLKRDQDLADGGDAIGLQNMGERYRDGNGVPKDLAKARDCFEKAVKAGNFLADDELKKLNQALTESVSK